MKSDAMSVPNQVSPELEKRSLNPWLLVFGAGFGFVVLVVVGLSLLALLAPKQSLRANEVLLPDGKVLRIEGVTWGRTHRLDYDDSSSGEWAFWERRRRPLQHGTGQDQLMVWMSCHDARSGRAAGFDWWSGSVAVDAHGDEIADHDPNHSQFGPRGSSSGGGSRPFLSDRAYSSWVVSSSLPLFRTDEGRFKLRVKNLTGEVVATFELKHPSPPVAQTWTAEELPATKTDREVSVTLKRLNAQFHWSTNNGVKQKRWYYSPEATVSENGQLSAEWHVSLLEVADPLGNQNNYSQSLSIREPVWKVRLAVCRAPQVSKFLPAETWTLTDVPLPEKETAPPRNDSKTIDGVTVTFVAMAGSGKTSYSIATPSLSSYGNFSYSYGGSVFGSATKVESKRNGSTATSTVEAYWPHLTLDASGLTPLHRLYLVAVDDQGRSVETQQSYHYGSLQSFFFKTEPDAKSLTLSVIVHKGREFEFFIKPPELPEDKTMP